MDRLDSIVEDRSSELHPAVRRERMELHSEHQCGRCAAARQPMVKRKRVLEAGRLDRNPCPGAPEAAGKGEDFVMAPQRPTRSAAAVDQSGDRL